MTKPQSMSSKTTRRRPPAMSPEMKISRCVSLAYDLAEKQLEDGSASSQIISKFLELGTKKAELEIEKAKHETELLKAKTEALKSQARSEEVYKKAIAAFRSYSGQPPLEDDDYEDD